MSLGFAHGKRPTNFAKNLMRAEGYVTQPEAARMLGYASAEPVREYVRRGYLPSREYNGFTYVERAFIEDYLRRLGQPVPVTTP